ncbi:small lysine-rich protein 1 [Vulpes vulpes]|uniref:Small lysine-rich protein 1 n=1 Tax=Vulpes vulpes TaxID=9627 RepID=A0ABM5B1X0_VULVU
MVSSNPSFWKGSGGNLLRREFLNFMPRKACSILERPSHLQNASFMLDSQQQRVPDLLHLHQHLPGKGKQGKSQGKSGGKKQKKPEVDILSPAAMLNLYYIAHNVADCLHLRGFRWPGAPKSKKGKNKT